MLHRRLKSPSTSCCAHRRRHPVRLRQFPFPRRIVIAADDAPSERKFAKRGVRVRGLIRALALDATSGFFVACCVGVTEARPKLCQKPVSRFSSRATQVRRVRHSEAQIWVADPDRVTGNLSWGTISKDGAYSTSWSTRGRRSSSVAKKPYLFRNYHSYSFSN